jgi:hypothetical protein
MFIYRIVPTAHVSKMLASLALVIAVIVPCGARAGGVTIVLSNRFINGYANRATIDATVDIAYATQRPHSKATDGDEHAAGTSKKIGLVTVVEIMNAHEPDEREAVADLEEAGKKTVSIVGFWRLWPEHAGAADFVQSGEADEIANTRAFEAMMLELVCMRRKLFGTLHWRARGDARSNDPARWQNRCLM